jgi:hypothetical protein
VTMGFSTSISPGSPRAWSRARRLHMGVCARTNRVHNPVGGFGMQRGTSPGAHPAVAAAVQARTKATMIRLRHVMKTPLIRPGLKAERPYCTSERPYCTSVVVPDGRDFRSPRLGLGSTWTSKWQAPIAPSAGIIPAVQIWPPSGRAGRDGW